MACRAKVQALSAHPVIQKASRRLQEPSESVGGKPVRDHVFVFVTGCQDASADG